MKDATSAEFLAITLSHLYRDAKMIIIGANSPIPAAAALLAQTRDPSMRVMLHAHPDHVMFTNGASEQYDFVSQGRCDLFVLGGVQIDGQANINLVAVGDYIKPKLRAPGSFGSAFVYFTVPRVILFSEEHTTRNLVKKVDFISAPGTSPPDVHRVGGPTHLVTGKAVFTFSAAQAKFSLVSVHPGETEASVRAATAFDFTSDGAIGAGAHILQADLDALRGQVADELRAAYPEFVRKRIACAR